MPNNDYLDFLAHHGILGQKWGVRRYQNPDGTLTNSGKRRYGVENKKYTNIDGKQYSAREIRAARKKTKEYIKSAKSTDVKSEKDKYIQTAMKSDRIGQTKTTADKVKKGSIIAGSILAGGAIVLTGLAMQGAYAVGKGIKETLEKGAKEAYYKKVAEVTAKRV